MAIHQLTAIVNPPVTMQQQIGWALYQMCGNHFVNYLGQIGLSLSYDSCCAAVAIAPNAQYDACVHGFSVLYGSSRLFKGLDPDVASGPMASGRTFSSSLLQEHAEQTAILTAVAKGWASGPTAAASTTSTSTSIPASTAIPGSPTGRKTGGFTTTPT